MSCVRDENNKKELSEKNKLPIIDQIITGKARSPNDFTKNIFDAMKTFIILLETDYDLKLDYSNILGTKEFEGLLSSKKSACEIKKLRIEVKIIEFLLMMNKALLYYNELTVCINDDFNSSKFLILTKALNIF